MSPAVCPNGHSSESTDYCDTCGAPVQTPTGAAMQMPTGASTGGGSGAFPEGGSGAGAGADGIPGPKVCPHCGTENAEEALFCESCGYDFTTGTPPRAEGASSLDLDAPDAAPDPDVNVAQGQGVDPTPPPPPVAPPIEVTSVVEIWVDPDWHAAQDSDAACPSPGLPDVIPLNARSVLVGRRSASRGITPEVDCGADIGVSRRHAQLTTDGRRWWVEDLQSANGTYVGPASGPLPTVPIPLGRHELDDDDRVYVGAWTRLVVRDATPEERA